MLDFYKFFFFILLYRYYNKIFYFSQIGQLYDKDINELRCSYCKEIVEEDQSALPKTNSRLLMARYNDQLGPLYTLLQEVEGIKLSPELLEPEPTDINALRGYSFFFYLKIYYKILTKKNFLLASTPKNLIHVDQTNNGPVNQRDPLALQSRMQGSTY